MLYRELGNTGKKVSTLGFGCMRFQVEDNDPKKIIEDIAIKQIRYGIDNGINYIDTAYPYHGEMSEQLVAKALKDGYRDKVYIADKLPSWMIKSREDMDKYLNTQLDRLQTEYIDFYLLHALNKKSWSNLLDNDVFDFIEKALNDGRIKHIGFSFHDDIGLFKEIVDGYDWSFCQIQYNLVDENYQAGLEGIHYARKKGLGIVIMEPLRGGSLANKVPDDIKAIWDKASVKRSPAEWALKFLWDSPEIDIILSGMNDFNHIDENIRVASEATPGSLTPKDHKLISKVRDLYNIKMQVPCTVCKYCVPCPFEVDIPMCFEYYNNAFMYDDVEGAKTQYFKWLKDELRASNCRDCGKCEQLCPQHIEIRKELVKVKNLFEV